jgi:hypothetical protein
MMPVNAFDLLTQRIDGKLVGLTPNTPKRCIFRVYTELRNVNKKAYEPQLLAIGPYHRGKDDLKQMEEHKLWYLKLLLQRRSESSVKRYIDAMGELEESARKCYAEPISLNSNEFIEMLLLDGCFIIELFRRVVKMDLRDKCDPIFQLCWMWNKLLRDLLLFENQLPLFVLTKLIEMTTVPHQPSNLIYIFMLSSRRLILPCGGQTELSDAELQNIGHVLAWSHNDQRIGHFLALAHTSATPRENGIGGNVVGAEKWDSIPSATELQEAGVKFKKLETGGFLDIKFNNGVMEIPLLKIVDSTESMLRNMIAYEQYNQNNNPKYFTEYMNFMDNLINSPKDVELLRLRGIIVHWLGDDEAVSTMFNKLGENVILVSNLCFAQIFRDVNKHCHRRRNVRMAKLRRNYFNSPWALISFLAATFLLILAIVQTIMSFVSYFVPKK